MLMRVWKFEKVSNDSNKRLKQVNESQNVTIFIKSNDKQSDKIL